MLMMERDAKLASLADSGMHVYVQVQCIPNTTHTTDQNWHTCTVPCGAVKEGSRIEMVIRTKA